MAKLASLEDVAGKTFDYVIIGGGTAGSILASRLTEDPSVSVALLEAGKARFDDPLVYSTNGWIRQFGNDEYDWSFAIEPQPHAKNAHNVAWHRAKTLGGSTTINAMIYTKPGKDEMDAIEALGNPGWNWEAYQTYARKAERLCPPETPIPDPAYESTYHPDSIGTDGPVAVSFVTTASGAEAAYQQALEKNGVPYARDAFGGEIVGIYKGLTAIDQETGRRSEAASAYILPALARPNLKVLTSVTATRLLLEKDGTEVVAKGAEFEYAGERYTVHAKREVILSAGTIKTPQLLELSGIGDRAILAPLGIDTLVDLPGVGANAQDHIACTAPAFLMKEGRGIVTDTMLLNETFAQGLKEKHNLKHPYSLAVNAFAFTPLQLVSPRAQTIIAKKAQEVAALPAGGRKKLLEKQLELMQGDGVDVELYLTANTMGAVPDPDRAFVALPANLAHPWSRGTVHVRSADPLVAPRVDPAYFSDATDLELLAEGFKFARRLAATEPLASLVEMQVHPLPNVDVGDDEKVKQFVSENIMTIWHTCGTASMLPREDGGVVDPALKVYGTANLRVVDLSVLPLHVSSHPQAWVYSMAERAADIIKGKI